MSSSTLPHCASARLHSARHKARQILPTFHDESALPRSAPKQEMCVNWFHLDQNTSLVSVCNLISCTAITWGINMHPEKYDRDKYIIIEIQNMIFFVYHLSSKDKQIITHLTALVSDSYTLSSFTSIWAGSFLERERDQ